MNASRRDRPRRHRRGASQTHALGEWPALEALRHRPHLVREVLLDPALTGARRARIEAAAQAACVTYRDDERRLRALRHRSDARALALLGTETDRLRSECDHLALLGTRSPGNLGVVLRTALGFDVRDIALVDSLLDPWSPHVLRASQGARFALHVARFTRLQDYTDAYPARHQARFVAPTGEAGAVPLPELRLPRPATLVFGPEWPPDASPAQPGPAQPDASPAQPGPVRLGPAPPESSPPDPPPAPGAIIVSIPQHPELESHNLAVAVGIALYALRSGAAE